MHRSKLRKFFRTGCKVVQALVPARDPRRMVSSMLAALLLASNAQAQTQAPASAQTLVGDWRAQCNGTFVHAVTERPPCWCGRE